jgi:hypothetical protein
MTYKKFSPDIFSKEATVAQVILLVIVILVVALAGWSFKLFQSGQTSVVYLEFRIGDKIRAFEGGAVGNMTLLDAINEASLVGKIEFGYKISDNNEATILQIAGEKNKYKIYLNSREILPTNLNKTEVLPGDRIEIRI